MPRRSKRSIETAASPRSSSPDCDIPVGRPEFNKLKKSVQGIFKRLELLERVFVLVDFEQINQILCNYSRDQATVDEKVGIDQALAGAQWDVLPGGCQDIAEEASGEDTSTSRSLSPTDAEGRDASVPACGASDTHAASGYFGSLPRRLPPLAQSPPRVRSDELLAPVDVHPPASASETTFGPDVFSAYKRRIWDGITSAKDEDDQKSSCSTWDLRSTQDGWNEEPDIDPNVFSQFMKQALRPKWESRLQAAGESAQWVSSPAEAPGSRDNPRVEDVDTNASSSNL
jgi:hypothetical protein